MTDHGTAPLKLLFVGNIGSHFDVVFSKVSKLVAKKGPFDALFAFTDPAGRESMTSLQPYLAGEKAVPVPTFVVGQAAGDVPEGVRTGDGVSTEAEGAAARHRVRFLSGASVITVRDLKVAYLAGSYNAAAYSNASDDATTSSMYFSKAAVDDLKAQIMNMEGDLDLLLTSEWPAGVDKKPNNPLASRIVAEVAMVARPRYHISGPAATTTKPGGAVHPTNPTTPSTNSTTTTTTATTTTTGPIYYQRLPYVNDDKGTGKHATRFIGLAPVANPEKQQWMQALALVPCEHMPEEQFRSIPPDATPCPYKTVNSKRESMSADAGNVANKRVKRMAAPSEGRLDIVKDKSKTVFVRNVPFAATEEDIIAYFAAAVGTAGTVEDVVRKQNPETGKLNTWCHIQFSTKDAMERACQMNEQELMGRKLYIEPAATRKKDAAPVDGCWFCLSNPNADIQLVASVGQESYVVLDKGPINDTHVLILPIEHHACTLDLPSSTLHEVARYMSALSSYYASLGKVMVGFERFMRLKKSGGNHCHVNVLGVDPSALHEDHQVADAQTTIQNAFEDAAKAIGHTFTHIPSTADPETMRENLRDIVGDGEYFAAILPDGSRLVHPLSRSNAHHPLAFGRQVLATIAGTPHRADWKVCKMKSADEEQAACDAFKSNFQRFDVNMMS